MNCRHAKVLLVTLVVVACLALVILHQESVPVVFSRIVVTPAGRRAYMRLLLQHLECQRTSFDEWHLWQNTNNEEDLRWMHDAAANRPWIKLIDDPDSDPSRGNRNIHIFFKHAADPSCVYLRLDDDVVWLEPRFVKKMFDFRVAHPWPFLVYGNIINNAVITYIHQQRGKLFGPKRCTMSCSCDIGWNDPLFAEVVHRVFMADVRRGALDSWHFPPVEISDYARVSINAIAWFGSDFRFATRSLKDVDEEEWLSTTKPRKERRPCLINGDAICAHFSFFTQRDHLDTTDILRLYATLQHSG